jgi:putative FmdB family regulatory protein
MPIYEYRCQECDRTFELLVRDGGALHCPSCGSTSLTKLLSVPHVSTGSAARQAGHTCCGREERCDAPPCGEGAACWRG